MVGKTAPAREHKGYVFDNSPALKLDDICSPVENRGMTKTKVDCTKKVRNESAEFWVSVVK
jgi:hypothetical protein